MFDLRRSPVASPECQTVARDPGREWRKDAAVALDAPPDDDTAPLPEARWSPAARRTGVCGAVGPRAIALRDGGFRLFYSQILPRAGFPAGANDYDHATTRILSAHSDDGQRWTPEPGVRLSSASGGAGDFRVVSSEVTPTVEPGVWRMYFECCPGTQAVANSIRSAVSRDEGLTWEVEPGERIGGVGDGANYSAPRIVWLDQRRCRLYVYARGLGIVSAVSDDGLRFEREAGLRIGQDGPFDSHAAFACEIVRVVERGYVMYYAGYRGSNRAFILRATSDDGLSWTKEREPAVAPGPGGWDAAKCSEMCLIPASLGLNQASSDAEERSASEATRPRFRMLYEACDGTAVGERGVWRIAGARNW